jgi:hypothetical protein
MPTPIRIQVGGLALRAELNDTPCAKAVAARLPIEAHPQAWGEELYFDIGLDHPEEEGAATEVKIGEIGYWPPGCALAIFFGRTPASTGDHPIAASAVNRIGRILDDATILHGHLDAQNIRITQAEG